MKRTKVFICGLMVVISTMFLFNPIGGVNSENEIIKINSPENNEQLSGMVDIEVEVLACFCDGKTTLYVDGEFVSKETRTGMSDDGYYEVFVHEWDSSKVSDGEHKIRVYDKHHDNFVEITIITENGIDEIDVVRIISPDDNSAVKGDVTVTAEVLACFCNSTSSLYIDGEFVTHGTPGRMSEDGKYHIFIYVWDSREAKNGGHTVKVLGKHGERSDGITVFVNNDGSGTPSKQLRIVSPRNDDRICGKIVVKVEKTTKENTEAPRMYVNDQLVTEAQLVDDIDYDGEVYNIYAIEWDTSKLENGEYTLRLQDDRDGEYDEIQLHVENMGSNTDDESNAEITSGGLLILSSIIVFVLITGLAALFIRTRKE